MEIKYLGHASFYLKGKSASLVTDPYEDSIGLKFPKVQADIVTVSHSHSDHNNANAVSDVKKVVEGPGEYEIQGISIVGFPTFHDDKKGTLRGKNTIYTIEMDNLRIVHLGDLGHPLKEKQFEELGEVDILMIPVGGFYTINFEQAVELVRSVESVVTIPMHYKTPMHSETFKDLTGVDEFVNALGLPVEKSDKYTVTKDTLGELQKVVVLEPKN